MQLVIAEKPSVAQAIAGVIGASSLWTRALYSKRLSLTLAAMKSPSSSWTNRPAIVRNNFEKKEVDV